LIAIAEPVSRPNHIHEYKLTPTSLYAAASVELKKEDIMNILNKFCKNKTVPKVMEKFIEDYTNRYGKAKLVLQQNKYFIEAENSVLDEMRKIPCIEEAIKKAIDDAERQKAINEGRYFGTDPSTNLSLTGPVNAVFIN
jgi:DNA excision repair protein ERCC-3